MLLVLFVAVMLYLILKKHVCMYVCMLDITRKSTVLQDLK